MFTKSHPKSTNASQNLYPLSKGRYAVTYEILPPADARQELAYSRAIVYHRMQQLFEDLSKFNYEFTIRNAEIPMEEYLSEIMLDNKSKTSELCLEYNDFLRKNATPAHNNFRQTVYLTLTTFAPTAEAAAQSFNAIHDTLCADFQALYGYKILRLSLSAEEHQQLLNSILQPTRDPQSRVTSFQSTNASELEPSEKISNLASKSTNATTKRPAGPSSRRVIQSTNAPKIKTLDKNTLQLGPTFARTFFLNCIPANCVDTIFHDITAISPNSLLSIHYEPVDLEINKSNGDEYSAKKEEKSVEDRANTDFYILASFIICLFADSREDLDRDTKLLQLSTAKYHCRCQTLDFAQEAGLRTALPLGKVETRIIRKFTPARLARLLPLNIQSLFSSRPVYHGINRINGNLVMLDRTNAPIGLIAGSDHSGKTTAIKREALNAILSTDDTVYILTPQAEEYQTFCQQTGAILLPIDAAYQYGTEIDSADISLPRQEQASSSPSKSTNANEIAPLPGFFSYQKDSDYGLDRGFKAMEALYQKALKAVEAPEEKYGGKFQRSDTKERVIRCQSTAGTSAPGDSGSLLDNSSFCSINAVAFTSPCARLICTLDYLWNESIRARKANRGIQIFVDGIDALFSSPDTSDYLLALLDNFARLQIRITMVVQHSAAIVADPDTCLELDYFLQKITYAKLFTQGPVERKKYIESFSIPSALAPYIADQPPGNGLIITPTANIPFTAR